MTQRPTKYNPRKTSLDPLNPLQQRYLDRKPADTVIFQCGTDPTTTKGLKTERQIYKFDIRVEYKNFLKHKHKNTIILTYLLIRRYHAKHCVSLKQF